MRTELMYRDGDALWLTRRPLREAHGAEGLAWPIAPEAVTGRLLIERTGRGDAVLEDVRVVEVEGEPLDGSAVVEIGGETLDGAGSEPHSDEHRPTSELERWSRGALERAWQLGEVVLAPTLAALVFDHEADASLDDWYVSAGVRMLPVRTPTLPPATHTNAFLIGEGDFVLVEPAPVERAERERLVRWVRAAQGRGGRLVAVLATHHHHDHIGAADLARELGVPLVAHAETAARMRTPVDETLEDGAQLSLGPHTLRAVHTPGHAPGHLCFAHEPSRTALVGDMVAGVGTILVEPGDGDMGEYLRSLERLRDADFRKLLPAHGGVLASPHAHLSHYLQHRLAREAKVLTQLKAHGPATTEQLLPYAYDDAPRAVWPLALLSLEAHLAKLADEGRAHRDGSRWSAR